MINFEEVVVLIYNLILSNMPKSKNPTNLQIATQILLPEILKDYPEIIGVMFCGSRAGSDFYDQSDFDFRCLLPEGSERFRVTKKYQDYWLECFFNSRSQDFKYFEENHFVSFKMYQEGVILYDPEGILAEIKKQVLNKQIKPKNISKSQLGKTQYTLATLKEKLSNPNLSPDKILFLQKAFQDILNNYQLLRTESNVKYLKIDAKIQELDPNLYTLINSFVSNLDFGKKKEFLIEMIIYLQKSFDLKDTMEYDSRKV